MVGPYWDGDISGTAFPEEIVHYLQDNLYENGIGQYFRGAMSNIEFEAKVITDLILMKNNKRIYRYDCKALVGIPKDSISDERYYQFLSSIRKNKMQENEYKQLLNIFARNTKYKAYQNKVNNNLKPKILNEYGHLFTSNNCR